jgi:ATP-binding cassette subfamily B protein/subfamily B ATP-binding cassette protein MsbA
VQGPVAKRLERPRLIDLDFKVVETNSAFSVYRRAFGLFRPFTRSTLIGILLSLLSIAFGLLKPWPFKIIVDDILVPKGASLGVPLHGLTPTATILLLCLALVLVHLLAGLLQSVASFVFIRVGLQVLLELRTRVYTALQALSLKFHDSRATSDSSFRVAYDSQSIQTLYNKGFTTIFSSVITLMAMLAIMACMDWQLTLLALAIVPFVLWAIRHYAQRVRRQSQLIQERESAILTVAQEGLSSIRAVHAFGREEHEVSQLRNRATESLRENLKLTYTNLSSALIASTLMAAGTALLYYVGSLHVLSRTLTLGELLVFSAYLLMLYQPIEQLAYTAWALEGAAAGAQRCFDILDQEDEVAEKPTAHALQSARGHIKFEGVCFSYDTGQQVLNDINFEITPRETVAIVGSSGAGKSTLLSLIPRFYDPSKGVVRIDGHDVCDLTKQSLRQHISIVLQDTILFSTTIMENIAYGRQGASEADIEEAANRAQAHDFIEGLPHGYQSRVGERGCLLSVGQRQRIGIARAFLKNAPILLLDEPTSALDPATEALLMDGLTELMRGRTTLIVTHRVKSVHANARILVIADGKVVESGYGPELVQRRGIYARLYNSAGRDRNAPLPA